MTILILKGSQGEIVRIANVSSVKKREEADNFSDTEE